MSPSDRSDVLLTLRQVALAFSSVPGRFGMEGETYYWTSGYHLNIRLYEKLLFGLFDILEDGQLIEVWIFVLGKGWFILKYLACRLLYLTSVSGSRRDPEVGEIYMVNVGHHREAASRIICLGAFSRGINCLMQPYLYFSSDYPMISHACQLFMSATVFWL